MKSLIDKLNETISKNDYFLDENGEILQEKLKTSAMNLDDRLIDILLSDNEYRIWGLPLYNEIATKSDFMTYFKDLINTIN